MISQERADACIEDAARELMEMSYDELKQLDRRIQNKSEDDVRELEFDGENVAVFMMLGEIGVLRKRICVELVLHSEDGTQWKRVPCAYFERYKSGKLYVARASSWVIVGLYAYFLVGLAIFLGFGFYFANRWLQR